MVKFYEQVIGGETVYMYNREGVEIQLGNDNFIANLHEQVDAEARIQETPDAIYDRVCVEDPEDGEFWVHWRADHTQEEWMSLEFMARRCATILIRQTALESIVQQFRGKFCADIVALEFVPDAWEGADGGV